MVMGSPMLVSLMACAQAFRDGNLKRADEFMELIWNPATNEQESFEAKSVVTKEKCCAEALVRRAYRLSPNDTLLYVLQPHRSICGKAIRSAMMGKNRVHIIDFFHPDPDDWVDIIDISSLESGGPSSIRLSVIAPPSLKKLYKTLYGAAIMNITSRPFAVDVEWDFKLVFANSLADVDASELEFRLTRDEIVIVRYAYIMKRLLAQPGAMERELLKLRQIKPEFVITVERKANHNSSFIDPLELVLVKFDHVSSSYDYMSELMRAVECDGMSGIEMAQLRSLLHAAGFLPFPLNQSELTGVFVEKETGCWVVSGERRPPLIISAWKFTDSVHHSISMPGFHQKSLNNSVFQTSKGLTECFTLNRVAAVVEMHDILDYVCTNYELPLGLAWACWANVKPLPTEITPDPYKKRTLLTRYNDFYDDEASKEFMDTCVAHKLVEGQAIAGKLLQSNESLFIQDITELDESEYPFAIAARKFGSRAALAISFCNRYVGDDVYVLEFYFPSSVKNLEDKELLKDRILHDLDNMKKMFVAPRVVNGTGSVGVRKETISNSIPIVTLATRTSLPVPASATGHNLFNSNETRSLNTTDAEDHHPVGTVHLQHEQGAKKKNRRDINLEMVKENRGTLTVPQTKRRKLPSKVWEHFTKFEENALQWAECNYCNKKFTGSSKSGTTHLKNHLERCPVKKIKFPTQISSDLTSPGANEGNSIFDQERTRLEFAKTIIKNQCLLDVVEDECHKNFLRTLQPMFELPSREIILSDIYHIYKEEKKKLGQYFDKLGCNYSLAIRFGEDKLMKNVYCCLVAYFINDDWELKKKIIAFKILDRVYDSQTLKEIIRSSPLEWNISKKICSITVNSLGLNDDIVDQIKENCLVGQACLPSGGCYNSCTLIEDGLHEIDDLLLKIRKLIEYLSEIPSERLKFQDAVNQLKLLGGKSRDDCPLRLDSGFEMLDLALKSREVFFQVEQSDDNFGINLSQEEWDKALWMHRFFKESLSCFGGIDQSLTANVYFPKLCGMYRKFLGLEKTNSPYMKLMKMKFDNYWTTHYLVFAIATVLDPRLKFKFVEVMYGEIYGRNSKMELNKFHKLLMHVYDNYANEPDNQISPTSIFGDSSCSTTQSVDDSILKSFWRHASKKTFDKVASWKSELDCYLDEPLLIPLDKNDEFFDILDWWRINTLKFPRLGRMARDILAIRVSTTPPHSSFSTLITNLKNTDLGPEIIEAFVCSQDWLETPQTDNKSNQANVQIMPADKATWRKTEPRPWSEEDIQAYLVSPFTPDEEKQITTWESSGLSGDSVVRDKMINVEPLLIIPHDKESRQKYYIDDSVVNEFFELLKRRAERFPDMYVKHYSFDSYIAKCLIEESKTDSVLLDKFKSSVEKKQDKIVELKDAEKLFLPLCFGNHWMLFYADTKKQKLVWLDSNRSSVQVFTEEVADKISRWFKGHLLPFLGYDNANEWQFQAPTDIPMQENSVDCALFVMKYADCLTHGDCFPFSQKDMAHFRHRTLLDIYQGSLFQPEFRAK